MPRQEQETKKFDTMDTNEAAMFLKMTPETVRFMARKKNLPAHRKGGPKGDYIFFQSELDAWIRGMNIPCPNAKTHDHQCQRCWETKKGQGR